METARRMGRMVEKPKPKKPAKTDKEQSERFKNLAKELEADGDLDLTDGSERLEALLRGGPKNQSLPSEEE